MDNLKALGMALLIVLGAILWVITAVDALEYETTGECRDCIILDKVRNLD